MPPDLPLIESDVACERCDYNLRTLTVVHRCPECGHPALRSVLRAESGGRRITAEGLIPLRYRELAVEMLSGLLGFETGAILHVLNASRLAAEWALARQQAGHKQRVHVSAAEICDAVREHAVSAHHGTERAYEMLRGWGITRSEDVGRIVAGLAEAGLIRPSEADSPADFKGVFTLERWLAQG